VAHSKAVGDALQAAEILEKEGISAEVINLRSIRPLDIDAIVKRLFLFFSLFAFFFFFFFLPDLGF